MYLRSEHTQEWLDFFVRRGYANVRPLAAGVEGAIYHLGDETVAKVWRERQIPELVRMQNFYADVARAELPFETPQILRIEEVNGVAVTFDRELSGEPLQNGLCLDDADSVSTAIDCLIQVIRAFSTVPGTAGMRELPVLDEKHSLWVGAKNFPEALNLLLQRRVSRFGSLLRARVTEFDRKYGRIIEKLSALSCVPETVIHGDLYAENILVNQMGKPTSVLDFGLLSTAGDPRLDAAITTGIFDMYSPQAKENAEFLTTRFSAELGYSREVLLLYRAVYALASSNFLSSDGSDGHFAWCIDQLNDPQVVAALDL